MVFVLEEEVESEEEKQKKIQMQRARQEFFVAMQEEGMTCLYTRVVWSELQIV